MNTQRSKYDFLIDGIHPEHILANWSEAVTALFVNYNALSNRTQTPPEQWDTETGVERYVGQCAVSQLITLLKAMQRELAKLLLDMDQSAEANQPATKQYYKKLHRHTTNLDRLNRRAQTMIRLTALPAS